MSLNSRFSAKGYGLAIVVSIATVLAPRAALAQQANWSEPLAGDLAHQPPLREFSAIAHDPAHGQTLVFGGTNNGRVLGDTWLWDGSAWIQVSAPLSSIWPAPRSHHHMAFDGQHIIMFGGWSASFSDLGDTWAWDATNRTWILESQTGPSPRFDYAMAYDATNQKIVLFGGRNSSQYGSPDFLCVCALNDTWLWDGLSGTWTQPSTVNPPPTARALSAMAYDGGHVVMYGGWNAFNGGMYLGDMWLWTGTDWTQLSTVGGPGVRGEHAMAYDDGLHRALLFGGDNGGGALNDTWAWDGTAWTRQRPAASPPAALDLDMAFDSARQQAMLFGGESSQGLLDTWLYGGGASTTAVTITVPGAVQFTFKGNTYAGSQVLQVQPGTYTLSTASPQVTGPGSQAAFASWSDAGAQSHSVVVGATSVDITGTFTTQFLLETSASPGGAGTISPTTGYIDQGTPITVTATAFPGATFTSWSGDCTGSDPCQLAMTKPMAVTANFTVTSLTVTIIVPAGVQFVFSGATYTGTQTLTVPPGAYGLSTASAQTLATGVRAVFVSWSDGGAQAHQIIAPATVGGSFKTQDLVTVTVAAAPENQGAASGGGWYDSGTTATIIATPNAGAELYYWNQGAFQPHPAEATFSFNVVAPVSFVAHFGTKQNWVQLFPSTSPDPRDEFAMAYCTTNNTTHAVLFGGLSKQGKTLSDTWVWDGVSTWMSIATPPGSTPSARSGAAMAEDSAAAVLMFGGTDAKGSVLSDTWVFDCTQNQWTLIQPTTVPPGRTGAAMASSFGPLMFGGRNGSTYLGDTWQWTGTDWLLLHPAQSPAPRANAAMALHVLTEPYIQHISIFTEMLFGGTGSNNGVDVNFSDTWAWDQSNVTWILQPPAATPPGTTGPMATNVLTGQLLLFDPNGGTWGNDGLSWAKKSPAVTPPARGGSEMQWNLSNGIGNTSEILLFGGHASASGAKLNDTWVWLTPSPSLTAQGATVTRTGGNYTVTMTLQNTGNVPDASIVITGADLGGAMSKGAGSIGRLNPGATGTISATFSVKSVSSLPGVPVTVVFVGTYSANGVSGIPWTGTLLVFLP